MLGRTVRRTVLPNGLRILSEPVPAMRSVSVGIWVDVGSRDEAPALAGASHFLEHLLFKGTGRRSGTGSAAGPSPSGVAMTRSTSLSWSRLPAAVTTRCGGVYRRRQNRWIWSRRSALTVPAVPDTSRPSG